MKARRSAKRVIGKKEPQKLLYVKPQVGNNRKELTGPFQFLYLTIG